jgi:hypothetical protein
LLFPISSIILLFEKIKYQKEISFKSPSENIFYFLKVFILKVKIIFWRRVARSVFQIPQEENGNILGLPYYGKKYFMKR